MTHLTGDTIPGLLAHEIIKISYFVYMYVSRGRCVVGPQKLTNS